MAPPSGAAWPSTLRGKGRRNNPQMKQLQNHTQDETYMPDYIAKMWAPLQNNARGALNSP